MAGVEAIQKGFTHYTSARGIPELREALVADLKKKGLQASSDQLTFYPGSKFSIFSVFDLLIDEGDEVVIQDPLWPTYASIIEYLHGVPVRVKDWDESNPRRFPSSGIREENRAKDKRPFCLTRLQTLPARLSPIAMSKDYSKYAIRKGVPLILDLIYSALCYDEGAKESIPSYDLEKGNLVLGLRRFKGVCDDWMEAWIYRSIKKLHKTPCRPSGEHHVLPCLVCPESSRRRSNWSERLAGEDEPESTRRGETRCWEG